MKPATYIVTMLAAMAVAWIVAFVFPYMQAVVSCQRSNESGTFLAYCRNERFASYEHAAYYFGLEPRAVDALDRSDVLMLGNSRTNIAFSTDAVDAYFSSKKIKYYIFGFGYAEQSVFPLKVLDRLHKKVRVLIINTDPFFSNFTSSAGRELDASDAWLRGWAKKISAKLVLPVCAHASCTVMNYGIYRRVDTGRWFITQGKGKSMDGKIPKKMMDSPSASQINIVENFIRRTNASPECVIFTAVPNLWLDASKFTVALAASIKANAIVPRLADLASPDESHLDQPSAERWSAAFLAEAGPIIERCLGKSTPE
jgi:hypothetical protein